MITVVLPAYNEEKTITPLLKEIGRLLRERFSGVRVIVVDDGSTDGTALKAGEFKDANIRLIRHPRNMGLSEAVKTGLVEALKVSASNDVIVTMDADNTHCPGLIFRMASLIDEGNDVIIGSRYVNGSRVLGISRTRTLLSFFGSILLRTLFPIKGVRDYTSGYRAYRADILKRAFDRWGGDFISEPGFSCIVDILLKLRTMNVVMNEVPLIVRYDYKAGESKMDVPRTIRQTLRLAVARFFFR
jgi:dolichol-phosphate mannosyltransferase